MGSKNMVHALSCLSLINPGLICLILGYSDFGEELPDNLLPMAVCSAMISIQRAVSDGIHRGYGIHMITVIAMAIYRAEDLGLLPFVLPPPSPAKIPFESLMVVPTPFHEDSATKFAKCHLYVMSSPKFLASSTWTGVQTGLEHGFGILDFDPWLEHVKFVAENRNEDGSIKINAQGVESATTFTISGELKSSTGVLTAIKTTGADEKVTFEGVMTPFGLVGNHGKDGVALGYFWLWPEAWMATD